MADISTLINPDQAERLVRARRNAHLSGRALAVRLGLTPETISRYENARAEPPELVLIGYSFVTGATLEYLKAGTVTSPDGSPVTLRSLPKNRRNNERRRARSTRSTHPGHVDAIPLKIAS